MNQKDNIGIIGLGILGSTLSNWFKRKKNKVYGYDKFKKIGSLGEVDKAKIIFLCLPTPYHPKYGYDLSALEENIKYFKKPKIFVIKSTVLPGTTEYFQKKYKKHKFLHNPEFLREVDPINTFLYPDLQIIGYTKKSKNLAKKILNLLPKGKFNKTMPATAAEIVKQAINSFLSTKVIFANQIYDLCKKLGVDYEFVKEALENESRIGKSHLDVFHGGYRGFGGKCLPKDLNSFIYLYKKLKLIPELFNSVWLLNLKYLKEQKLIEKLKKDWLKNKS